MWRGRLVLVFACALAPACQDKSPPVLDAAVAAVLPVGTASSIAVSPSAAAPTGSAVRPAKIVAQHILVAWRGSKGAPRSVTRSKAEAKKRADEVVAKVHAGEDFSALVRPYSDDPGSADRLGSVGKFAPKDMDPAFSAAAFALRVDETSAPVETPFGFHVIRRTQ